jgi:hypothetical protein
VWALFRRPERREGDGRGKAPGDKSKEDCHRDGIAQIPCSPSHAGGTAGVCG